jgi:hypothetical protein
METKAPLFQITGRGIFTLCALFFTVIFLWLSADYPPRARYVPQVVAIFSMICLIMQLGLECFPGLADFYRKVEKAEIFSLDQAVGEQRRGGGPELRLEIVAYSWLLVLLGGLLLFGFLISIPLYVLFYLRFQAQLNWLKSALYGVGTWIFVYLLFVRLFEIRLYPGILIQTFLDF